MSNLNLVIDLLYGELTRHNMMNMHNKQERKKAKELPGYKGPPLFPEDPEFVRQTEEAISILQQASKTRSKH